MSQCVLARFIARMFGNGSRRAHDFSSADCGDSAAMMVTRIIDAFGYVIYAALALLAVWGVYNGILLYRTLMKKTIREPEQFIDQVRDLCEARRYDAALNLCQSPPQWHTALAQLVSVALSKSWQGAGEDQATGGDGVSQRSDRRDGEPPGLNFDDRADGPAAGSGGHGGQHDRGVRPHWRVRESGPSRPGNRHQSGLWATGAGLLIANPMMLIGNDVHAKLRRLRDRTERQLQDVLEFLEPKQ